MRRSLNFSHCETLRPRKSLLRAIPLAVAAVILAPGAASAATTVASVPATPIAGEPVELNFSSDAASAYEVRMFKQSTTAACAAKPSLQSNQVFEDQTGGISYSGPHTTRITTSFSEASTFRVCVYLSPPNGYYADPIAVDALDITIAAPPQPAPTQPAPTPPATPQPPTKPQPPACALADRKAKRGKAVRVRCYRVTQPTIRVRYRRNGRTVTKSVALRSGVARAGTRGLSYGTWSVTFLTKSGKVGSGRIEVKRR